MRSSRAAKLLVKVAGMCCVTTIGGQFSGIADSTGTNPAGTKGKTTVDSVHVTGDTATAEVTATSGSGLERSGTLYFRKESGEWRICFTDSPQLKQLQNLPGMK